MNDWGKCEILEGIRIVSVYPSEIGAAMWQYAMNRESASSVPAEPPVVHREDEKIVHISGEALVNEGRSLIAWETFACQHGWLDLGLESLSGSCQTSLNVEEVDSKSELMQCLYSKQSRLSNTDRKVAVDADQILKDMPRYINVSPEAAKTCGEISLVWLTRVVPWFSFMQGSSESCFYLVGMKSDVPHEKVLSGLIWFTDEVIRVSRYSRDRGDEYMALLAFYWGRALDKHFGKTFTSLDVTGEYFNGNLLLFLMRPATSEVLSTEQSGLIWQFLFTNGRPGLWAYYIAAVKHGSKCFYSKGGNERNSPNFSLQILQQPMLYCCVKGFDASKVIAKAKRILSSPIYDSGPKSSVSRFFRQNVLVFPQLVSMIDFAVENEMGRSVPGTPQSTPPQDERMTVKEIETKKISPHNTEASLTLSELIDMHEPFNPVVNNVVRDLMPKFANAEYSTMVQSVLDIGAMCKNGDLFKIPIASGADLHGTRRKIPQDPVDGAVFLKSDSFLTPLLSCLSDNYLKLDSILSGYLWALAQIRKFLIAEATSDVNTGCEEILSVYAIVYANSADAIMNGEPVGWCLGLGGLMNAEGARLLSNFEILKAIAVIGNKLVGMTRFGPSNASEYTMILSKYLEEALNGIDSTENVGTQEERVETVATIISSFGREKGLSEGFWKHLFYHGQAGLVCWVKARLRLARQQKSSNDVVDHDTGLLKCQTEPDLEFEAMVKTVFRKVDLHMSQHLSSIGSQ